MNPRLANSGTIGAAVGYADPGLFLDNKLIGHDPELLTVFEAASFLTVSVATVRRLQAQRAIPFIKVGGSVRFDKRDLAAYVERNRIEPIGT